MNCVPVAELQEGEIYTAEVDRISNSGNGIIIREECGLSISRGSPLLIPEADQEWVGEYVEIEYLHGNKVKVISRDVSQSRVLDQDPLKNQSNPVGNGYLSNKNNLLKKD